MTAPRFVAVILFAALMPPGRAVEPGLPSKTAVMTTAARAIASHDPDPGTRNPDWLAERFLGATERRLLEGTPWLSALSSDYRELSQTPEVEGLMRVLLVRTRFIDEHLIKAVENGAEQVVILGAGFDSRAYRLREMLRGKKVIEVDYGPTQEYKKRRVQDVLGCLPAGVIYVPIDFRREKIGDVLQRAGYRRDRKSFFIWEGVTFYLPEEAVRGTLRYVATQSAPGSSIVADFMKKSLIDMIGVNVDMVASPVIRGTLIQAKRAAELGEPWLFGIPDDRESDFLRSVGLQLDELMAPNGTEAVKRYRTRKDGTLMGTAPAADSTTAWLVKASVVGH